MLQECKLVIEAQLAVVLCWGCSQQLPGLELSEPEEFAGFEGGYWLEARKPAPYLCVVCGVWGIVGVR